MRANLTHCLKISISTQLYGWVQSCLTLCDPMDCSTPGLPVHNQLQEFTQTHIHWVGDAIHFILCCPLLLQPSVFPSIRVFSNKSVLHLRWPKYWSFSLSISPSNEHQNSIKNYLWIVFSISNDSLSTKGHCSIFFSTTDHFSNPSLIRIDRENVLVQFITTTEK